MLVFKDNERIIKFINNISTGTCIACSEYDSKISKLLSSRGKHMRKKKECSAGLSFHYIARSQEEMMNKSYKSIRMNLIKF